MKTRVKLFAGLILLTAFAIIACSGSDDPRFYSYTVTFDSQDATKAADPAGKTVQFPAKTVDALPAEPTKNGYIFGGWYTAIGGGGTEFTAATTVSADITVYAKWTVKLVYAIGDTGPGGGVVFYTRVDGTGGLEVAPALWNGGSPDPGPIQWSTITNAFANGVSALPTGIGTGSANTDAIILQNSGAESAAKLCRDYTGGGFSDWFLPSRDELAQLWTALASTASTRTTYGFNGDYYWSSSEGIASRAWHHWFSDFGGHDAYDKISPSYVRPVRAFGTPLTTEYFNDGFEGGGWNSARISGDGDWSIVTSGTHPTLVPRSGSHMALFPSYDASSGHQARIYRSISGFTIPISPASVTLSFFMYHDPGYPTPPYDRAQVQVSTDGGSNWINVGSAIDRYSATEGWIQHTLDLSAYKGQTVILGFVGISEYGNNMYLDDVSVIGLN